MKRILFPTLLIATLLAGGLVALAIWRTSPVSAEDYVKSGKALLEEKKYTEATIQFLNAVQSDERNREARLLLVQSYLSQGDLNAAVKQLHALLDYLPNDKEAKIQLGTIYLRGGARDIEEAKKIATAVLNEDESNVEARVLLGNAFTGLKDYEKAVQAFEKVVSLDPKNPSGYISLGTVQMLRKSLPEAEQSFLKALELDPKGRATLLSLGNYYRALNNPKKAEEIYKVALEVSPSDPMTYGPLAALYTDSGRFEEAVSLLTSIQAKDPKDPRASFMLSDLLVLKNQEAEARRVLLNAKKENPDNLEVAAKLAVLLMKSDPKRSREEIDQILKAQPKSSVGLVLRGENQFWTGDLDGAKATLSEPQAANSGLPEAQYFLGAIAVRKGQMDIAEEHYRKALVYNPNYLLARSALAGLLLDKGRITDARVEIAKVLETNKNYVPGRLIKVALDIREQRYEGVEQELLSIVKDQPTNPEVHRQLAAFYFSRGRNADTEKALIRALELQPDAMVLLQSLIQFYVQTKQYDKAIQRLTAIPEDKKQAAHYEMLGSVYTEMKKPVEAEAAYTKALEKDPKSNADAAIAAQYIQSGRTDEGLRKLDELIKKNPANGGAYTIKGIIYENQGKMADAKQSYTRALQIDANLDVAANNLAYLLAEEGRELETALTWAQSARRRQPEFPGIADTLGWVYYKLGNPTLARDQLQFAASKEPNNPVFQYHLGMIYIGNNQRREAADALRKAVNSPTDFKEKPLAQAALKDVTK
jgi:tetratricopeptide (TPR) repeat protein